MNFLSKILLYKCHDDIFMSVMGKVFFTNGHKKQL